MYTWMVYLHLIGIIGFLIAHGISIGVAFELKRERNLERIRSLLNLSGRFVGMMNGSLLIILIAGIVTGFMGNWWGKIWIWLSLIILLGISIYMSISVSTFYHAVRKASGLEYMVKYKPFPPVDPVGAEELDNLLNQSKPVFLATVGVGGLIVITWLMVFKPF